MRFFQCKVPFVVTPASSPEKRMWAKQTARETLKERLKFGEHSLSTAAMNRNLRLGIFSSGRVFGEGVKSARGETAILGRGDHTRNMFGTSLHTTYCKQSIVLKTEERMQEFFDHCKLLRRMNYCDSKQLLQ